MKYVILPVLSALSLLGGINRINSNEKNDKAQFTVGHECFAFLYIDYGHSRGTEIL
jgi:hypothetical protein